MMLPFSGSVDSGIRARPKDSPEDGQEGGAVAWLRGTEHPRPPRPARWPTGPPRPPEPGQRRGAPPQKDPADQAEAVRMEAGGAESDQHVAGSHAARFKDPILLYDPDAEAGQVEPPRLQRARMLRRLAAQEGAPRAAT